MTMTGLAPVPMGSMSPMIPHYPFASAAPGALPPVGFVCSPYSLDDENALSLMRYATGAYNSNAVTAPGAQIEFPKQKLELWLSGADDPAQTQSGVVVNGTQAALSLTEAETNALREGAIPKGGAWFLCYALGVVFMPGWVYTALGGVTLLVSHDFYAGRFARVLSNLTSIEMKYQDTKITNVLGLLPQYPPMGGHISNGNDLASGGNTSMGNPLAGANVPFSFPFFAGSRCGCDQIQVELELERDAFFESESSAPGGPTVQGDTFQQAVRLEFYGTNYCLAEIADAYAAAQIPMPSQFALAR
jgi:hypothetical protein